MEELKKVREETEKTREESGAVDLRPGEIEGMVAEDSIGLKKSRAMEKRKRELEERRKMIDAKRRKKDPASTTSQDAASSALQDKSQLPSQQPTAPNDPFSILESRAQKEEGQQPRLSSPPSKPSRADEFLAALERDMMKGTHR